MLIEQYLLTDVIVLFDLQANSVWLFIVPHGIRSLMNYIRVKYGNPTIIITENGKLSKMCTMLSIYTGENHEFQLSKTNFVLCFSLN